MYIAPARDRGNDNHARFLQIGSTLATGWVRCFSPRQQEIVLSKKVEPRSGCWI